MPQLDWTYPRQCVGAIARLLLSKEWTTLGAEAAAATLVPRVPIATVTLKLIVVPL